MEITKATLELPEISEETLWVMIIVIIGAVVIFVVGVLKPDFLQLAYKTFVRIFYDVLFLFGGPRPPVNL